MLQSGVFANVLTVRPLSGGGRNSCEELPAPPSSDELVELLRLWGAVIVARYEHGSFLRARRRLVFVRCQRVIEASELNDVLRAAGMAADRFAVLLADTRRLSA